MRHHLFTLSLCASLLGISQGYAATPSQPTSTMDEVVVTANRRAQTVDDTLVSVSVIGRKQIEQSAATNMPELLQGVAGITMSPKGGYGSNSTMHLRGTNAGHVLVLVDGIKVGSATTGQFSWEHLPPSLIERIEVVRGPLSSLYGSEAIGGVVQIFTRKQTKKGLTAHIEGGLGNRRTQDSTASIAGSDGKNYFSLAMSRFASNGFNAMTLPSGENPKPDDDGYLNLSFSARLGRRLHNGEIEVTWMRVEGDNDFDDRFSSSTDHTSETLQQTAGMSLRVSPMKNLEVSITGSATKDSVENFADGTSDGQFTTKSTALAGQGNLLLGDNHILTTGIDARHEQVSGISAYDVTTRDLLGLFMQLQSTFGKHDWQLGGRWDDIEEVGKHTTYNAAWGYNLPYGMRLTASHGTGFKAPTFNQLYYPEDMFGIGNPNLKPEKSKSWELGLDGKVQNWRWSVHTFHTKVENLINWTPVDSEDPFGQWNPSNIATAKIQGVETTLRGSVQDWDMGLNMTWMNPKDDITDKRLTNRPTKTLQLDLDRTLLEDWRLGTTLHLQDHQYGNASNTERVAGHGVVHLRGEYTFAKNWLAKASIKNLLDHNYQATRNYNAMGRMFLLTLGWRGNLI